MISSQDTTKYQLMNMIFRRLRSQFHPSDTHLSEWGFGFRGAPSIFQKLIGIVLQPAIGKYALVFSWHYNYISKAFAEHVGHLKEVSTLLNYARLTVKLKINASSAGRQSSIWDLI